jgi:hypothetical protein
MKIVAAGMPVAGQSVLPADLYPGWGCCWLCFVGWIRMDDLDRYPYM